MRESWRWFGENDPVSLDDIRQAGATDVVCALYDIPAGIVWPLAEIHSLKHQIEQADPDVSPLRWSVVESIPVHEDIKLGKPSRDALIDNWIQTLKNLAIAGIEVVCYNFMPVIDWTRTDLRYRLPTGAYSLRFDQRAYAAFDLHVLQRPGAEGDYTAEELEHAQQDFDAMSKTEIAEIGENIIAGLPGRMTGSYDIDAFRRALENYDAIDRNTLAENLDYFLDCVVPAAENAGIKLAIHPDDPPWSLFGLPRVVCNADDVARIAKRNPSLHNGLALCAGTFGSDINNDVPAMAAQFGERIHFAHLRSVEHDEREPRTFLEAGHLEGNVNLIEVVRNLLAHEAASTDDDSQRHIFIRPDHGHQMMDDLNKSANPGYTAIGRLKGLAEMRGVIRTLQATNNTTDRTQS